MKVFVVCLAVIVIFSFASIASAQEEDTEVIEDNVTVIEVESQVSGDIYDPVQLELALSMAIILGLSIWTSLHAVVKPFIKKIPVLSDKLQEYGYMDEFIVLCAFAIGVVIAIKRDMCITEFFEFSAGYPDYAAYIITAMAGTFVSYNMHNAKVALEFLNSWNKRSSEEA